jgi:hypothetical protein
VATSRRWWLPILGAGAVAAALFGGRTVLVRSVAADEARLRSLEARVALLESRLHGPRGFGMPTVEGDPHLVVPGPPPDSSTPAAALTPAPAARPAAKKVVVDEVALQRSYFGELDARLAGETRDPVWSAPTEELLRGSTRDLRPRLSIDAAQCGQTMCRVETTADPQEEARALDKFLAATVALLPEAVVRDGEQPGHRIVYFARKTGDFPPMTVEPETATP